MKIVVDDKIPYLQGVLETLFDEVVYLSGNEITSNAVASADVLLIRTRTKCDRLLLDGSKVRFIATATIGHDHIDKLYCQEKGISWVNAPGCNAYGVVQYVLTALCHISNAGFGALKGRTLGIVGVGEVGSRLAKVAPHLGLKVLLNDPPRMQKEGDDGFVDLDYLIQHSDIITLHVPLERTGPFKTFQMVDDQFFGKFNQPKVFINASRGEVVDDLSLIAAITRGDISHAIIDVWNNEPNINLKLLELATIATPHIAGYSLEGKANGTAMSVMSILQFLGRDNAKWYPTNLPTVSSSLAFNPNADFEQEICRLVAATYDIAEDDRTLREKSDQFEQQRGGYKVRREISFFEVSNVSSKLVKSTLEGLTFKVHCNE